MLYLYPPSYCVVPHDYTCSALEAYVDSSVHSLSHSRRVLRVIVRDFSDSNGKHKLELLSQSCPLEPYCDDGFLLLCAECLQLRTVQGFSLMTRRHCSPQHCDLTCDNSTIHSVNGQQVHSKQTECTSLSVVLKSLQSSNRDLKVCLKSTSIMCQSELKMKH